MSPRNFVKIDTANVSTNFFRFSREAILLKVLIVLICLFLPTISRGQNRSTVSEFDPGFTFSFDLSSHTRLDVYTGKEKSEELHSSKQKIGAGISIRLRPLFKSFLDQIDTDKRHVLVVGLAYEYSRSSENNTTTSIEKKVIIDGTVRWELPAKVLVSDRNRFEFRLIDHVHSFRYRNRTMLERPFELSSTFQVTPYASAEAFRDQRYDRWSKFEFTGGIQIPLYRRTSLDSYYTRVHCVTCADPHTNIYGMSFNIFLPFKKK